MAGETSDTDPVETREWLESVDAVVESDGRERMGYLLDQAIDHAQDFGVKVSAGLSTPYVNTIPVDEEPELPGDPELERLATALVRWNAIAIVLQANAESSELGGHIASYQSAETLYEVGFNHFWRARSEEHGGDLVYMQGHSSPGIYSRAFLEGRLTEEHLHRFRQEVDGGGLSSYPHPWLMPEFWQFPTVSMGLGPLMAIYQARFMKYLAARDVVDPGDRKVWAFMGDGEMDEPESMGAISLAGREKLDNLVFVDQLQPAAPRRAGARQREDHPGARDELPRRRLERDQGDLGLGLGSAARERHRRLAPPAGWRRRSTASTRPSSRRTAPTSASTSSASTPRRARWWRTGPTSRSGSSGAAATTRRRSMPPTPPPSRRPASRP